MTRSNPLGLVQMNYRLIDSESFDLDPVLFMIFHRDLPGALLAREVHRLSISTRNAGDVRLWWQFQLRLQLLSADEDVIHSDPQTGVSEAVEPISSSGNRQVRTKARAEQKFPGAA